MKLFLDLDGVLADFDSHHEKVFGHKPVRDTPKDVDWKRMTAYRDGHFYADLPPMADAGELWDFAKHHHPTILTAVPYSMKHAALDKRTWVDNFLGPHVPMLTCFAKDKCQFAKPGDVLVDDSPKYKHLWEAKGGVWVTHTRAAISVQLLKDLGFGQ